MEFTKALECSKIGWDFGKVMAKSSDLVLSFGSALLLTRLLKKVI